MEWVTDQLAPVFERPIAGHHCRTRFVAPHDDLEQHFAATAWQLLHSHIIHDQEVRLQIPSEQGVERTMQSKRQRHFLALLAEVDQRIADAEEIALKSGDSRVQLRAARLVPQLQEAKARVERLIRLETARIARNN